MLLLWKRRVTSLYDGVSDLSGAQMRGLRFQMLGPGSYEELLLSWYHMHIELRCYHISYKFEFVNWWLSCEYITCGWLLLQLFILSFPIFCTANILEYTLTPQFFVCVDGRCAQILRNMSSRCCELEDGLGAHLHLLYHLSLVVG